MAFLDKLGQVAGKVGEVASDTLDYGKAKGKVVLEKGKIKDVKEEIGEYVYQAGKAGEELDKEKLAALCAKIDEFNVILNIPATLKEFGIDEDEFKEKIATISELAIGDACTGSNPRTIDAATMEKLFYCVYYGTEVDF